MKNPVPDTEKELKEVQELVELAYNDKFRKAYGLIIDAKSNLISSIDSCRLSIKKAKTPNKAWIKETARYAERAVIGYSLRCNLGHEESFLLRLADALAGQNYDVIKKALTKTKRAITEDSTKAKEFEDVLGLVLELLDIIQSDAEEQKMKASVNLNRFSYIGK